MSIKLSRPGWFRPKTVGLSLVALAVIASASWVVHVFVNRPIVESCPGTHIYQNDGQAHFEGQTASFDYSSTNDTPWRIYSYAAHAGGSEQNLSYCNLTTAQPTSMENHWLRFVPPISVLEKLFGVEAYYQPSQEVQLSLHISPAEDNSGKSLTELKNNFIESEERQQKAAEVDRQRGRSNGYEPQNYTFEDIALNGHPATKLTIFRDGAEGSSQHQVYYFSRYGFIVGHVMLFASGPDKTRVEKELVQAQPSLDKILSTIEFK